MVSLADRITDITLSVGETLPDGPFVAMCLEFYLDQGFAPVPRLLRQREQDHLVRRQPAEWWTVWDPRAVSDYGEVENGLLSVTAAAVREDDAVGLLSDRIGGLIRRDEVTRPVPDPVTLTFEIAASLQRRQSELKLNRSADFLVYPWSEFGASALTTYLYAIGFDIESASDRARARSSAT